MHIFLKSDSIIKILAKSEFCPLVTILQKSLYKDLKNLEVSQNLVPTSII